MKQYKGINKFKNHNCKLINDDENIDLEYIECSECDLTFDSIESMSLHYFEKHEKKNKKFWRKEKEEKK